MSEITAHLSLAATFQRQLGRVYDALHQGTMDVNALAEVLAHQPLPTATEWYAVDASVWPRCDAETSPERGYSHHHTRQSPGQPVQYNRLPLDETFAPIPEDPYSLSKFVNEETCATFSRAYGLHTAAMRFGVVWSEAMYQQARQEGLPPTQAWADDLFSWVHIADIALGLRLALEAPDLPLHGVYTLNGADTRCPEPTRELLARFRPALLVMGTGLPGGTSFMEDYTYHLDPAGMQILGSHMLEISEDIAAEQPRLEVHPLAIGGKADPVRLVFDARNGPAVAATIVDMGNRFRMVVNEVDAVPIAQPLPKLPVARALWVPQPTLQTATTAWILAGGAHHTGLSYAVTSEHLADFAQMAGIEFLLINRETGLAEFPLELRWNEVAYRLATGL